MFAQKKDINFIIYGPDFTNRSGGGLVLHELANIIACLGFSTYFYNRNSALTSECKKNKSEFKYIYVEDNIWDLCSKENTVVVYPEVVCGNPLKAKYVSRWILNAPGVCGGDGVFHEQDKIFYYSDLFRKRDLIQNCSGIRRNNDIGNLTVLKSKIGCFFPFQSQIFKKLFSS